MATPFNNTNPKTKFTSRAAANLPASTAAPIFTLTGDVVIHAIIGEVLDTAIEAQTNSIKLISNPTVGADVDLCAALDIDGDAIGTIYQITGTLTDALVATTSGASLTQDKNLTVAAGTIDLDCTATNTGKIKWTVFYTAVDTGAIITAV